MPEDRISAIDIFEDINAQAFPFFIPRLSLLWVVTREDGDPAVLQGNITLRLDDEQLGQFPLRMNFEGMMRNRQILVVGGLVVPRPGRFRAIFHADHIDDAVYEFQISAAPQGAAAQAHPPAGP